MQVYLKTIQNMWFGRLWPDFYLTSDRFLVLVTTMRRDVFWCFVLDKPQLGVWGFEPLALVDGKWETSP